MYKKEKRALKQETPKLKNDIWVQKVSIMYIQPNLQCCQVLLFVAYHRIMWMNFVRLPSTSWVNFEAVLIWIFSDTAVNHVPLLPTWWFIHTTHKLPGGGGHTCKREEKSSKHTSDRKNVDELFRWGKIMIRNIYKVWYGNVDWIFVAQEREDWQVSVSVEIQFWVQ